MGNPIYDIVYRGKVLRGGEIVEATVTINNGRITGIHGPGYQARAELLMDYSQKPGAVLLPGIIDIHVHLRGLEYSYKEDEETGTLAAAMGGVTLVADMPNTKPPLRTPSALEAKLESLRAKSYTDYAVYLGVPLDTGMLGEMMGKPGVVGLKIYPEDLERRDRVVEAAREAARRRLIVVVHPEHPGMIRETGEPGERWRTRPLAAEFEAVKLSSTLARLGTRLHYTHVTSATTVTLARQVGATTDTCPHYLLLSSKHEEKLGCAAKVNPPLRPQKVVEGLIEALREGLIDAISSDHAPHAGWEKEEDFAQCPSGIPGVETMARLILTLVNRGVISLAQASSMMSTSPAMILGIPGVGRIEPGYRANLTLVDMNMTGRIRADELHTKAPYTPFDGFPYRGAPIATIVGGQLVMLEGILHSKPGTGEPASTCGAHGPCI